MINNNHSDKEKSLICSLYTYNYSLFTAYLDGSVKVFPLPKLYPKRYENLKPYNLNIPGDSERSIIEMQAYKHVLFASTSEYLYSFDLKKGNENHTIFQKEIPYCTQIKIDYKKKFLFAVSDERGLVTIDISNPHNPKFKTDIYSDFKRKNYSIVDMDVDNGIIFLAVRNYGILRIDYSDSTLRKPKVYREIEKIYLEDPQDVKYSPINKHIYICDANKGLITLDTSKGEAKEYSLNNDDIPRKVIIHYNDAIIQGKKGLYYFNFGYKTMSKIFDYKIGTMTKYYNQLVYCKNNSLNLIILEKSNHPRVECTNEELSFFKNVYRFNDKIITIK